MFAAAWDAGRGLTLEAATDEATALLADLARPTTADTASLPPLPGGLTSRETEVLRLLARRWTDREIAEALSISPTPSTATPSVCSPSSASPTAARPPPPPPGSDSADAPLPLIDVQA